MVSALTANAQPYQPLSGLLRAMPQQLSRNGFNSWPGSMDFQRLGGGPLCRGAAEVGRPGQRGRVQPPADPLIGRRDQLLQHRTLADPVMGLCG
jgi:hypothetical protein